MTERSDKKDKKPPQNMPPENLLEILNSTLGGFNLAMGLYFTEATLTRLVARVPVTDTLYQPYGLVHGGVYAAMIESLCSSGAALNVFDQGKSAVGIENSTSFLRAVRSGVLTCTATPLVMGRRSHVWEASVCDDQGRLVATGRVRLMILEKGSQAAGAKVELAPDHGG
ncbi:putative thioesterase [Desulforapulum autotrophicum HRM2]|uniref:Thioesterase n=1 Tax=Desulforapulum autotrophicum (strain ATCC 43914 / DSM 3382 / VKM B-1955 / HRM2) TaxID=177437 RepID=C0QIS6_DESAH|nr:PaaI family thioesterase [Desulforapulum autotrophicum]ACN13716.1 putative thioesterase [Desulforapulum autotrophicum HRM2]